MSNSPNLYKIWSWVYFLVPFLRNNLCIAKGELSVARLRWNETSSGWAVIFIESLKSDLLTHRRVLHVHFMYRKMCSDGTRSFGGTYFRLSSVSLFADIRYETGWSGQSVSGLVEISDLAKIIAKSPDWKEGIGCLNVELAKSVILDRPNEPINGL